MFELNEEFKKVSIDTNLPKAKTVIQKQIQVGIGRKQWYSNVPLGNNDIRTYQQATMIQKRTNRQQ